ncbi:alpha/beta fold hydrolase [Kineosporia succinea]|uniref:Pimeloyl-ACP methyl ester carboxylesterase n=1 Tax=Kineosporia succinea TaxID=84632 RepID=A0ABT9NYL9_9ACTN|nr:alpha/beta hydrolase [Kineosporia succinea]MDP9825519.1 pimeloyl-ACP methyl ester carboxylesterase [Kineosporia succinea]
MQRREHRVPVTPDYELWVEERGSGTPLVLVMGANASGAAWPDGLVDALAAEHRVIRFDHRDTGRSTWAFDEHPYALTDLASDVVAVLDALGVAKAHVVGMSLGGTLVQLLLLDHPERLFSATVLATAALDAWQVEGMPGPSPQLLDLWEHLSDERDARQEMAFRVEHWRLLNGPVIPFDDDEFRRQEQVVIEHTGHDGSSTAHARASQDGLDRGAELAAVTVPTLVLEAPADPINPPPHAEHIARVIGNARLVSIPGMGHALPSAVHAPLAAAVLEFTSSVPTND